MSKQGRNGFSPRNAAAVASGWKTDKRWKGITRPYTEADVAQVIAGGQLATTALKGSTEEAQFEPAAIPQRPAQPTTPSPALAGD